MATLYWVNDNADGDWAHADNWSAAGSGGVGGDGPPTTGDDVVFDGGNTDNCTLFAAGATANMSMAAGYTGTLDINGQNIESQGDVTLAGAGAINFGGAGTWDIYGNLDWSALASTLEETGHTVRMLGATKTYSGNAQGMGALEIHGDTSAGSASTYSRLYGALTVKAGATLTCTGTYNFDLRAVSLIEATGVMTSASSSKLLAYAELQNNGTMSGSLIATFVAGSKVYGTGTFSCGAFEFQANCNWGPATFGNASVSITNTTGTSYTQRTYGDTLFNCPVTFSITGAGNTTINNATGNFDLEFSDDITVVESSSGVLVWSPGATATITFSGSGDQSVDLNGLTVEALSFNKSGGTLTLTDGFTTPTLTVESGSTGTIDLNDQDITISGDATFEGSGTIVCGSGTISVGGNFDNSTQGTWTYETATWQLTGASKTLTLGTNRRLYACEISGSYEHNSTATQVLNPIGGSTDITGTLTLTQNLNSYGATTISLGGTLTTSTSKVFSLILGNLVVNGTISGSINLWHFNGSTTIGGSASWGGSLYRINNTVTCGAGTIGAGEVRLYTDAGNDSTLVVGGNLVITGTLNFNSEVSGRTSTLNNSGNHDIEFQGDVDCSSTYTTAWTKGTTGTITLSGATTEADFNGLTVEDIVVNSVGGTVTLTGDVAPDTLTLTAGTLDLDTFDVTTASYSQAAGTTLTAAAVSPGRITTSGNVDITGTSGSGCVVTNAEFNIGGTGTATYTTATDSDASGGGSGAAITATNSTDGTGNTNWVFIVAGGGGLTSTQRIILIM